MFKKQKRLHEIFFLCLSSQVNCVTGQGWCVCSRSIENCQYRVMVVFCLFFMTKWGPKVVVYANKNQRGQIDELTKKQKA